MYVKYTEERGNGNEDRETWNERKKNENKKVIMRMKCRSDCSEDTDRYIGPCTQYSTAPYRRLKERKHSDMHYLFTSTRLITFYTDRLFYCVFLCMKNVHRVLIGKPEGKRPLGRPRRRWEDNIKMDLQEVGVSCGDWKELAQDRDRWRALVGTVRNFRVPKMRRIS